MQDDYINYLAEDNKIPNNDNGYINYLEEPGQEESFLQKLPRNVGAGLANLGHSAINTPHDAIQNLGSGYIGAAQMLHLLPKSVPKNINYPDNIIPHLPEKDYAQMLGQKGEPTWADWGIQKGIEHIPQLAFGGSLVKNGLKAVPHLTRRGASKTLSQAKKLASERNINILNVNPELIEDARQFLPNTLPNRNAVEAAKYGDYKSLFDLQSDVGKNAGSYAKSWFSAAERAHGKEGLAARNRLLDSIHENLQSQGHDDISKLLRQGQNEYRRYMKIKPYRNALATAALTSGISAVLPFNPFTSLLKSILTKQIQQ